MKEGTLLASVTLILSAAGCHEPSRSAEGFAQARFEDAKLQQVYEAAQATMEEFFRMDPAASRPGLIRSVPTLAPVTGENRPLGKPISTPPKTRQIAQISVEPAGQAVVVSCSVIVQRSQSPSQLTYAPQYTSADTPNRTPLKEDEGLAREGGEVWGQAGYDRKLAREMLAAIEERLGKLKQSAP